MLSNFFIEKGWEQVNVLKIPARRGEFVDFLNIGLSTQMETYLTKKYPKGIYKHQKTALEFFLKGHNVCVSTGTSSGKSLIFYISALEQLIKNSDSKIIAIYPLKALGVEQEKRWNEIIYELGLDAKVGRIDGKVSVQSRRNILKNSQILILTPDVIHAWLMYNLSDRSIVDFLSRVSLIVLDEIHNYTGVFGSNSAFLFRRMQHVMKLLNCTPRYIAASATITDPDVHLKKLIGEDFEIVSNELDTSPRHEINIRLVNPPENKDLLSNLSELMEYIANKTSHKFISFVDSRKQTEHISSIVSRFQLQHQSKEELNAISNNDHLLKLNILPYRAGYEEVDREIIQERLSEGTLKGIISTSALELGIDIKFLTLCILVGVPRSGTSFYQRIGRIGRHTAGDVVIVNTGDIYNESIFRNPDVLLDLPLSEGALYLENQRIQYIHALCLARHGGEHDQIASFLKQDSSSDFESQINWPKGFIELCKSERVGVIPTELQNIKAQAGDDPNHTYPLRDVDTQFQVEYKRGPEKRFLGSLSYGQLMREAYPGAVYYYTTKPYRVYRVNTHSRIIEVRSEKKYTTTPQMLPTLVFPNLTQGNTFESFRYNELIAIECNLQIREAIIGFKERRGPNEINVNYPLDKSLGIFFDQPRFTRNYFTTGVVFSHPKFNDYNVKCDVIASLLYEAFLMVVPFERNDISFATDKFRINSRQISKEDKFICIYDQTYGSLRLSGRILEGEILSKTWNKLFELIKDEKNLVNINFETLKVIEDILENCPLEQPSVMRLDDYNSGGQQLEHFIKVIMPGSKGLDIKNNNEEFFVEDVFYSPVINGLAYRGKHLSQQSEKFNGTVIWIPIDSLIEIPGETEFGLYDIENGVLKKIAD